MSSYFDALQRDVWEAGQRGDAYLRVALFETDARLFRDVTQVTGDREFPDDLREKMLGALAVYGCWQPGNTVNERAVEEGLRFGYSRAAEVLHSLFHELASRRVQTRFGWLSDSPTQIAVLRDEHDSGR